ncbi:MAG: UDP-N-acetylmuramate dehydrogenase [Bacteroidota bacterium]
MQVQAFFSLKDFNTFGIDVRAEHFVVVRSVVELREALAHPAHPKLILGGGSNVLLRGDVKGLVIHNQIGGITVGEEDAYTVSVAAGGGENWHGLVQWCIERGYGGIENLSLIPGTVGAAPIQNIGAYGVELRDVFERLEAIDLQTGATRSFLAEDCVFGYRDSIFKRALKGRYCISRVHLRLTKRAVVNTSYGAIREQLAAQQIMEPGIREVSEAVMAIRRAKLPDPADLGNAGSFFKNPELDPERFERLRDRCPEVPHYLLATGRVKVPAAWLIEQCGWKGKRFGQVGSHARQALVLVNYGGASGSDLYELSQSIAASVEARFGIALSAEVNLW